VMRDEEMIVFTWLLHLERKDEELLAPVGRLDEVIAFQLGGHVPVRIIYPKVFRIVPPGRQARHNVNSPSAHDREIQDSVTLLADAVHAGFFLDTPPECQRTKDVEGDGLAYERKKTQYST